MLSFLLCVAATNKVKNFSIFSQYENVNVIIFEYLYFLLLVITLGMEWFLRFSQQYSLILY